MADLSNTQSTTYRPYGTDLLHHSIDFAQGALSLSDPQGMGVPTQVQTPYNRAASGMGKLAYLDAVSKVGDLNQTMGAGPQIADLIFKDTEFGKTRGLAGLALSKRNDYLAATRAALEQAANEQPKQTTKQTGPSPMLTSAVGMGGDLGGAMMGSDRT